MGEKADWFTGAFEQDPLSHWKLPYLLKWEMARSLEKIGHELGMQEEIRVLPAMLAPDAYGYEEETEAMPLVAMLIEALVDKDVFLPIESSKKCAGVYRARVLKQDPMWYVSPGFVVTFNTVVNLCADAIEFGLSGFFWPNADDGSWPTWGISKRGLIARFHLSAQRDEKTSLVLSDIMRSFSRRLSGHIEWLRDYDRQYKEYRAQRLPLLEDGMAIQALPYLRGRNDVL